MRTIYILLLFCSCLNIQAQEKRFRLQGQIVDINGAPVSDVYIINPGNHDKDISLSNGVFTVNVLPGDSLILSHISYFRKVVKVHALLMNPVIIMESENVDLKEITVTPDKTTDYERAQDNMSFIKDYDVPAYTKIKEETDPVNTITTEHNRLMRTEASSVSLVRLPVADLFKVFKKKKRRKNPNDYFSTRKQKRAETKR
uniref:hypothetical protein n=1 Tax=uncultured Draconibacterium sp. TaxID=1573823 RepID=UPI003216E535